MHYKLRRLTYFSALAPLQVIATHLSVNLAYCLHTHSNTLLLNMRTNIFSALFYVSSSMRKLAKLTANLR